MRTSPRAATAAHPFFPYNASRQKLFAVRPGIPAEDALNMASNLLDVAGTCADEGDGTANLSNAAGYLTTMAKAIIDALVSGIEAKPDDCAQANVFARLAALRENGVLIIAPTASSIERDDAQGFLDWAGQQAKGGAQ